MAVFSTALLVPAAAQDACALIRSELASLHAGGGDGRTAQLRSAIQQQSRQLGQAEDAFNRFQCSFGAAPQCGSIVATIEQMNVSLSQMRQQLARAGGGREQRRMQELERAFATQCGPSQRPQRQQQGLLATIFGSQTRTPEGGDRDPSARVRPEFFRGERRGFDRPGEIVRERNIAPTVGDTFRTMCVRTTDGFYWPISFSTTRARFEADQGLCAAMCPGTAVELFAYRNPGQPVDAMVSTVSGQPYTEQPYAFAYREAFDPDNRCTPSQQVLAELRQSASLSGEPVGTDPSARVPQPSARPDMASDPETRGLDDASTSFETLGAITRDEEDGEQMVRVVGPNYGYFAN
ncbi:MAG: DUF2865 domain-containing protein [Pseudomonadota bacterium]